MHLEGTQPQNCRFEHLHNFETFLDHHIPFLPFHFCKFPKCFLSLFWKNKKLVVSTVFLTQRVIIENCKSFCGMIYDYLISMSIESHIANRSHLVVMSLGILTLLSWECLWVCNIFHYLFLLSEERVYQNNPG